MALAAQHEKLLGIGPCSWDRLFPGDLALLDADHVGRRSCWSTWPVYRQFEKALGGRRGPAAALMTLTVALVIVAPFALQVGALAESVGDLVRVLGRGA